MKKVLLVLAVVGTMVACNSKKKTDKPADGTDTTTTTTTNTTNTTTTTTTTAPEGVPTFADAEVQSYVNDYTAFVNSYLDAYKAKDMAKVQELSGKMTDWSTRSMDVSKKLAASPEEAKKFSDYMTALSTKWADAAKAMVPDMK